MLNNYALNCFSVTKFETRSIIISIWFDEFKTIIKRQFNNKQKLILKFNIFRSRMSERWNITIGKKRL